MSAVDIVHEDGAPIQATLDLWSGAPGSSTREGRGTSPSKRSLRTYATRLVPVKVRLPLVRWRCGPGCSRGFLIMRNARGRASGRTSTIRYTSWRNDTARASQRWSECFTQRPA